MSRILVTGGGSYLGKHLVPMAIKTPGLEVHYTYHHDRPSHAAEAHQLNVLDSPAVSRFFEKQRPEIVIHTVGSNRGADMDAVIRQGTRHVIHAAGAVGCRIIHLSTDVIFDGLNPPYDEGAVPCPVNAYGRAKAAAESIVSQYADHVIVRTSLIYGLDLMDHGTRWMAESLEASKPVTLFDNQLRNPVWVDALSRACLELAAGDFRGVINVAGRQVMSRAQFALRMLDWWGITARDTLTIGASIGGRWPLNCELDLSLAAAVLATPLPGVDDVLRRTTK